MKGASQVGDDPVDEAELERLLGAVLLTLHQHVHQAVHHPEHPHDTHDSTGTGQQPERHLGQADADRRVLRHDAVVAGQRELEPATERGAVDDGDRRHRQRLEGAQETLHLVGAIGHRRGVVGPEPVEVGQVRAGEEGRLRARQDDAADVLVGVQALHDRAVVLAELRRHRVRRRARVVEHERDDPVVALLVADGRRLAHACASVMGGRGVVTPPVRSSDAATGGRLA